MRIPTIRAWTKKLEIQWIYQQGKNGRNESIMSDQKERVSEGKWFGMSQKSQGQSAE